jgi:rod shape-determining protein MreC
MSAVLSSRIIRRRAIAYVTVLAATLAMMAVSSNPLVVELQRGISFAFRPAEVALDGLGRNISSIVTAAGEINQLRVENDALRAENERLHEEAQRAAEVQRQNELLTGLLQLRNGFEYRTVASAVIARDSSEAAQRIVLDRGTTDGIQIGDVVVSAGGALVGRVIEASGATATVQLISDSGSTVIGQLLAGAATGEVVGELPGSLAMKNIDAAVTVTLGEEVVTAGIELGGGLRSPYPKGLVIGQVVDVRRDANEVVQTAYLEPAATLDRLEYVLVILDYQGGLPPLDQQPTNCGPASSGAIPAGEQPCLEPTASPKGSRAP